MAGLINELITALGEMSVSVQGLIDLGRAKKDAVVKNDAQTLKEITGKENVLVGRFQRSERARAEITGDIATVLNAGKGNLTLKRIGEIIKDQNEYDEFSRVSALLTDKLGELKELNDLNRSLVENALEYIEFSVNVIHSTYSEDNSFMDDTRRLGDSRGFVDTKN